MSWLEKHWKDVIRQTAQEVGISNMTMDEINAEIKAVRKNAKNSR